MTYIHSLNYCLLNLITINLQCLSQREVLSQFHVAPHKYPHLLYVVYRIKGHSLLYRIWCLLASTHIFNLLYAVFGIESWHIWLSYWFVILIPYVYQYMLRQYHLHPYIKGTGIYKRRFYFTVYIPYKLILFVIWLDHYYYHVCVPIHY